MRIAVWSPLPPADSEIATHTVELLPALARHHEVVVVVQDPATVDRATVPGIRVIGPQPLPQVDLDVYQIGNSPAHTFVYRAALERPGVVVLHDWMLHDLVWHEAMERNDLSCYLREMRHSHRGAGSFVGRQVSLGRGGTNLTALYAVNDRLFEHSLGIATLTREAGERLRRRCSQRARAHVPQHVSPGGPLPSRAQARRDLGLPDDALLVTAPGAASASTGFQALARAVGRLRREFPSLRLVVAGGLASDASSDGRAAVQTLGEVLLITGPLSGRDVTQHLVAADVVSAFRFPSRGGMPPVLVNALGVGRPVLVTAGTPAAEEMPDGVVVPVDPGPRESEELVALLRRLLGSQQLREEIGAVARAHALAHHGLETAAARLGNLLAEVHGRRAELLGQVRAETLEGGPIAEYFLDEVRFAARDLSLEASSLGLGGVLAHLAGRGRPTSD